jgi:hypothetical protein
MRTRIHGIARTPGRVTRGSSTRGCSRATVSGIPAGGLAIRIAQFSTFWGAAGATSKPPSHASVSGVRGGRTPHRCASPSSGNATTRPRECACPVWHTAGIDIATIARQTHINRCVNESGGCRDGRPPDRPSDAWQHLVPSRSMSARDDLSCPPWLTVQRGGNDAPPGRTSRPSRPPPKGYDSGRQAPSCSLSISRGNKLTMSRARCRKASRISMALSLHAYPSSLQHTGQERGRYVSVAAGKPI